MSDLKAIKKKKLELLEQEDRKRKGLPHIYGFPWYDWAHDFFTTLNKVALLTAANQVSKSSTNIRTCIEWAVNKDLWEVLWPNNTPRQFWYLYPDYAFATSEFDTKWVPEFLPRGEMKDDPVYGWEEMYKQGKQIHYIQFKSGVRVYFKAYSQDVHSLQGSTVHAIFCDEEMPSELYSELQFRLAATNGYFRMVFTATRSQEFWREAMEEIGTQFERFKNAWKRSVSLYDCLEYRDGSKSPWTRERIKEIEDSCKDDNERLRRVHGRFVRSDSRLFTFTKKRNSFVPGENDWLVPPKDWMVFAGVDIGSGGDENSKSAIALVAVRPDFRYARAFRVWRGDGTITTAGDVFNKYLEMTADLDVFAAYYDYAAADFYTIAERAGVPFTRADKGNNRGIEILNTCFTYGILYIDDTGDLELMKLANELTNLGVDSKKGDDLADALRYALSKLPIDWLKLKEDFKKGIKAAVAKVEENELIKERRGVRQQVEAPDLGRSVASEIAEWNGLLDME